MDRGASVRRERAWSPDVLRRAAIRVIELAPRLLRAARLGVERGGPLGERGLFGPGVRSPSACAPSAASRAACSVREHLAPCALRRRAARLRASMAAADASSPARVAVSASAACRQFGRDDGAPLARRVRSASTRATSPARAPTIVFLLAMCGGRRRPRAALGVVRRPGRATRLRRPDGRGSRAPAVTTISEVARFRRASRGCRALRARAAFDPMRAPRQTSPVERRDRHGRRARQCASLLGESDNPRVADERARSAAGVRPGGRGRRIAACGRLRGAGAAVARRRAGAVEHDQAAAAGARFGDEAPARDPRPARSTMTCCSKSPRSASTARSNERSTSSVIGDGAVRAAGRRRAGQQGHRAASPNVARLRVEVLERLQARVGAGLFALAVEHRRARSCARFARFRSDRRRSRPRAVRRFGDACAARRRRSIAGRGLSRGARVRCVELARLRGRASRVRRPRARGPRRRAPAPGAAPRASSGREHRRARCHRRPLGALHGAGAFVCRPLARLERSAALSSARRAFAPADRWASIATRAGSRRASRSARLGVEGRGLARQILDLLLVERDLLLAAADRQLARVRLLARRGRRRLALGQLEPRRPRAPPRARRRARRRPPRAPARRRAPPRPARFPSASCSWRRANCTCSQRRSSSRSRL